MPAPYDKDDMLLELKEAISAAQDALAAEIAAHKALTCERDALRAELADARKALNLDALVDRPARLPRKEVGELINIHRIGAECAE